jgi:hypothetical protein
MREIKTIVYEIDEHPNKELCFEWIRNNWHDINDHSLHELVDSLKELSKRIGGTFDYSISTVPDRGEFIRFNDYSHEELCRLSADDLPLTGVCWDAVVVKGLRTDNTQKILDTLHANTEYQYSDEALLEMCLANEYEFDEDGVCI